MSDVLLMSALKLSNPIQILKIQSFPRLGGLHHRYAVAA
jgi:hypothetical protein